MQQPQTGEKLILIKFYFQNQFLQPHEKSWIHFMGTFRVEYIGLPGKCTRVTPNPDMQHCNTWFDI